jgi:hypothetical protein
MGDLHATGHGGQLEFDGSAVVIRREGLLARLRVGRGEKRIPTSSITAVQWRPAGVLRYGFIKFTLPGAVERRPKASRAARDENSVVFSRRQMPAFAEIRTAVEGLIGR